MNMTYEVTDKKTKEVTSVWSSNQGIYRKVPGRDYNISIDRQEDSEEDTETPFVVKFTLLSGQHSIGYCGAITLSNLGVFDNTNSTKDKLKYSKIALDAVVEAIYQYMKTYKYRNILTLDAMSNYSYNPRHTQSNEISCRKVIHELTKQHDLVFTSITGFNGKGANEGGLYMATRDKVTMSRTRKSLKLGRKVVDRNTSNFL